MYLSVMDVKALDDYRLLLKFENEEERIFDVNPYLESRKISRIKK